MTVKRIAGKTRFSGGGFFHARWPVGTDSGCFRLPRNKLSPVKGSFVRKIRSSGTWTHGKLAPFRGGVGIRWCDQRDGFGRLMTGSRDCQEPGSFDAAGGGSGGRFVTGRAADVSAHLVASGLEGPKPCSV